MRETKQVIVMRKDLNMRKGKMIAQGAHASLGIFTRYFLGVQPQDMPTPVSDWLSSSFKKVCVSVDSEHALLELYSKIPKEIPKILITDSGATEFNGVATHTCIAIGPWISEEIDKLTGDLKLL